MEREVPQHVQTSNREGDRLLASSLLIYFALMAFSRCDECDECERVPC